MKYGPRLYARVCAACGSSFSARSTSVNCCSVRCKLKGGCKTSAGGCVEWAGHRDTLGYGRIYVGGKQRLAHRIAYGFFIGPIPPGMLVLHRCDNPPCVNPQHLFLGTDADNAADRSVKGRSCVGASMRNSKRNLKLTESAVIDIVRSSRSHRECAERFGVSMSTIQAVRRGDIWRDVVAKTRKHVD